MALSLRISQGFTHTESKPLGKMAAAGPGSQRPELLALLRMTNGGAEGPERHRRCLTAKERGPPATPLLGPPSHLTQGLWLCGTAVALNGTRAQDASLIYIASVLKPGASPSVVPVGKGEGKLDPKEVREGPRKDLVVGSQHWCLVSPAECKPLKRGTSQPPSPSVISNSLLLEEGLKAHENTVVDF